MSRAVTTCLHNDGAVMPGVESDGAWCRASHRRATVPREARASS